LLKNLLFSPSSPAHAQMDQSPAPCIIFLPLASESEPRVKPAMASIILANSHLLPISQAAVFSTSTRNQ